MSVAFGGGVSTGVKDATGSIATGVNVAVGVAVFVAVLVGVAVFVAVLVGVGVPVCVGVLVAVLVGVDDGSTWSEQKYTRDISWQVGEPAPILLTIT